METRNKVVLEQSFQRGVWDTRIQQLVLAGIQELEEVYRERWAGMEQRFPWRPGSRRREQEAELHVLWAQLARLGLGCRAGGRKELLKELLKGRAVALGVLWAQVREEVAAPAAPAALPTSSGSPGACPPSPGASGTTSACWKSAPGTSPGAPRPPGTSRPFAQIPLQSSGFPPAGDPARSGDAALQRTSPALPFAPGTSEPASAAPRTCWRARCAPSPAAPGT